MLACVPNERHEAGLLAAAVLLELGGFNVTYLGADLPADELLRAVETNKPRLVLLSTTVEMSPAQRDELVEVLQQPAFGFASIYDFV